MAPALGRAEQIEAKRGKFITSISGCPRTCGGRTHRTERPGAFAPGGGNPTPGRSCWRPLHGCGFATKRAGEQDEGVCRKVQFQAVGAFGMAAHLWRRCQHAPAPQVEGEAEESDIGCVAQARKGAQANKTIAAFHRAEQASMAGGSRRRYDCEPPSEIASASAAHQSVGKPRAVSSRRKGSRSA